MPRSLVLRDTVTEREPVFCRVTLTPMGKNHLRNKLTCTHLARAQLLYCLYYNMFVIRYKLCTPQMIMYNNACLLSL